MAVIHKALDECSAEHPVFYEDEVDIHLILKSVRTGSCADSRNGRNPGQNENNYLAGALHSGTRSAT
jgi:hypothetical protein